MQGESSTEDREKKPYEVSFLVAGEEQAGDIERLLAQHGVEITQGSPLKKISLSYPVKHMTQAVFGFFHVLSEPQDTKSLEKDLKSNQNVLRSLIISLPALGKAQRSKGGGSGEDGWRQRVPIKREVVEKEQRVGTLSNEAIEKKIEEILQ